MIFYSYEDYFGKRRNSKKYIEEEENDVEGFDNSIKFDPRHMWLVIVQKFCEKLNYKPDEVFVLNYISCLNWLSLWHLQEKQHRRIIESQKRKLKR